MANELTHALLQTNGGQVASVLSGLLVDQLYDATDLRSLMTFVPAEFIGSDTVDVTQDANPTAFAAATNETTGGQSNTAYTTSKFSLTIARYVLQYQITDLLGGLTADPVGFAQVVRKIDQGVGRTMTDLVATLFGSLSNTVGTTTVDLVVNDIYLADFQLNTQNAGTNTGQKACVLYNEQMNNFRQSLRSETGAQQFVPSTAAMLETMGPGMQGTWNGIQFWQSDSVPTANAGADSAGALFVPGCFAYTLGNASQIVQAGMVDPADIILDAGAVIIERNRDATNGMSELIGNLYPSVVEAEDGRGVAIITDR